MGLFNRRKSNAKGKAVPPEVKQYYASEHRERVGLAWLIAFLSLILTVAVVAGLFFGGRWAYRKVAHKDNKPTTGVAVNEAPDHTPSQEPSKPNSLQPTVAPPTDDGKVSVGDDDTSSSTTVPSDSTPSSSDNSATDNQPAATAITNTGAGNTIGIFVAVTMLATLTHLAYQKRRVLN